MVRRQIKVGENEDRLFDFLKCQEIKKWREQHLKSNLNIIDSEAEQKTESVDETESDEK